MNPQQTKEIVDAVVKEFSDQGMLIEGGWKAYELLSLQNTSPIQRSECRKAFFLGAQHLFASIMGVLEPDAEPTEKDLERMDKIDAELKKFLEEIKQPPPPPPARN